MFILDNKIKNHPFRTYKNIKAWYCNSKRFKQLSLGLNKKSGRGSNGKILVYSKGSKKYKSIHNILSMHFKGFFFLSSLVQIKFDSSRTGLIGLFSNSIGGWFYSLLPVGFFLFDYIKLYNKFLDNSMDVITNKWPRSIFNTLPYSKICSIEVISNKYISKGIQFIRSAGSRGLLLDNKYKNILSIIVLPSLKIKILSNKSIIFLNYIENELYKYQKPQKAGYYVNKGRKPTVRGIVKNACDHPNGGRTRTILLSRTPWGKVAKKSRKKNIFIKLKSLSKRLLKKKNNLTSNLVVNLFQDSSLVKYISKTVMESLNNTKNKK